MHSANLRSRLATIVCFAWLGSGPKRGFERLIQKAMTHQPCTAWPSRSASGMQLFGGNRIVLPPISR